MSVKVSNTRVDASAQKIRPVCDLVRGRLASEALKRLRFCEKRGIALMITKLINSGLRIALDGGRYDIDRMALIRIEADVGRPLKRVRPRAQGRAFRIRKKSARVVIILDEV